MLCVISLFGDPFLRWNPKEMNVSCVSFCIWKGDTEKKCMNPVISLFGKVVPKLNAWIMWFISIFGRPPKEMHESFLPFLYLEGWTPNEMYESFVSFLYLEGLTPQEHAWILYVISLFGGLTPNEMHDYVPSFLYLEGWTKGKSRTLFHLCIWKGGF